ncbi:MAG: hypothetical protein LBU11_12250 [Zoogloeaceae bacterium]|jgi:hypothetical protein|nr:hypothetical protein [Zoogloeaceae bacterium]
MVAVFLGASLLADNGIREEETAPPIVLPARIAGQLTEGDLIFRIGRDWQSEVARGVAQADKAREKRGAPYKPHRHADRRAGTLAGAARRPGGSSRTEERSGHRRSGLFPCARAQPRYCHLSRRSNR